MVYTESSNEIVQAMGGNKRLSDLSADEKDKLFKLFAKWEGKEAYNLIKDRRIFNDGGETTDNNNTMKNNLNSINKLRNNIPLIKIELEKNRLSRTVNSY